MHKIASMSQSLLIPLVLLQSYLPLKAIILICARVAFDKAVALLSPLGSGEVQCNQTECDSWRKETKLASELTALTVT